MRCLASFAGRRSIFQGGVRRLAATSGSTNGNEYTIARFLWVWCLDQSSEFVAQLLEICFLGYIYIYIGSQNQQMLVVVSTCFQWLETAGSNVLQKGLSFGNLVTQQTLRFFWSLGTWECLGSSTASRFTPMLSMPGETYWGAWRFLWQPRAAGGSFCRMQRSRTIHWRVELVPWMLVCALWELFCLHITWLSHVSFVWSSFAALTAVLMHFSSMLKERFTGESRKNRIVAAWIALVSLVGLGQNAWQFHDMCTLPLLHKQATEALSMWTITRESLKQMQQDARLGREKNPGIYPRYIVHNFFIWEYKFRF